METFSISDSITRVKKEYSLLEENWKGDSAERYLQSVKTLYDVLVSTEKRLEEINEKFSLIEKVLNDEDSIKSIDAYRRISAGVYKKSDN